MDKSERAELLRRLFAAMTMELEDLAGLAADGQSVTPAVMAKKRAQMIRAKAELVCLLADTASALAAA